MAFFTKERLEKIKQQAQSAKEFYDEQKERQEIAKKERDAHKQYKLEKKVKYEGKALQNVGVIAKGADVIIKLNPDTEILTIKCDDGNLNVTLPYSRILGLRLECITEDMAHKNANLAGAVLSSGLFGHGVIGTVGRLAGGVLMSFKKKKALWVATLIYKDKNGITQELFFAGDEKELESDETPYKNEDDAQFERAVNSIVKRYNVNASEMTEL